MNDNGSPGEQLHRPRNISELLGQRTLAHPNEPFLISEADGRQFTYAEFATAVDRTAAMVSLQGISKGDVVTLLMPNNAEYIVAYFACWKLGALAGPVNSLLKSQELAYVIQNSEARALLLHSDFLENINAIKHELSNLRAVITFDNEAAATKDFSAY